MIAFVLGTRPEVVKLAPVIAQIPAGERCVIWTGQHWSESLVQEVWGDTSLFAESERLVIADEDRATSNGKRLGSLLHGLTDVLSERCHRWVVVQGDTDSALAGALAAAKLGIPMFHLEAGCRSGDHSQPEELNRVLIDHAATGHACSYKYDLSNLGEEGIGKWSWSGTPEGIVVSRDKYIPLFSGDPAIDSLLAWKSGLDADCTPFASGSTDVLATIHRAETLSDPVKLSGILDFLGDLAQEREVTLFAHPHLQTVLRSHGLDAGARGVTVLEPIPPSRFRAALARAGALVTDSGGASVEAAWMRVPCLMCRDVTELRDVQRAGLITVGGRTRESLHAAWPKAIDPERWLMTRDLERAWAGGASVKIAEVLRG